jgi:hypothetical protein
MERSTSCFQMVNPIKSFINEQILRLIMYEARQNPDYAPLKKVGTIHFAGFCFLEDLPDVGQNEVALANKYLLFYSAFDGSWLAYLQDFAGVVALEINLLWSNCTGYPGTSNLDKFDDYLEDNAIPTDWQYSAYPEATVNEVLQALDLRDRFKLFAEVAKGLDPVAFKDAYERFITDVQADLG